MQTKKKFKFVDIGRAKVNKTVEVSGADWEDKLFKEVKKCLASRDVNLVPNDTDTGWNVFAGFYNVGQVLDAN